ncbi:hypothetical protein B0H16DRAFT_902397 [Mycena metata]|uniref:Uncharacterized protein n=1 Tax=Mycena metata TaxID=1033252 RepID=A0AAD7ITE2_9AGAR|nr:hypothetical protein B0H16DRAFT_902397 [Mycena metata]
MYYSGRSGPYPDEYTSLPPPPDSGSQAQQWEQQESQHSQVPDNASQPLEQALEHPQYYNEPLSIPAPPPQQHQPQQLENPQRFVPSQVPPRGTHDSTPIRLVPVAGPAPRSPPREIEPIILQADPVVRPTAVAGPSTRFHPYTRPLSASGSTSRREMEGYQQGRFPSQASAPRGHAESITHSPATRCASHLTILLVGSPII